MSEYAFHVGDRVRFKTWERMGEEYGGAEHGTIQCIAGFTDTMDEMIDRGAVFTIESIRDGRYVTFEENPLEGNDLSQNYFTYSVDMIQPADKDVNDIPQFLYNWAFRTYPDNVHLTYASTKSSKNFVGAIITCLLDRDVRVEMRKGTYATETLRSYLDSYHPQAGIMLQIMDSNWPEDSVPFTEDEEGIHYWMYENKYILFFAKSEADYYKGDIPQQIFNLVCTVFPETSEDIHTLRQYVLTNDVNRGVAFRKTYIQTHEDERRRQAMLSSVDSLNEKLGANQEETLKRRVDNCKQQYARIVADAENALSVLNDAKKELCFWKYGEHSENDLIPVLKHDIQAGNLLEVSINGSSIGLDIKQDLMFFNEEDWPTIRDGVLSEANAEQYAPLLDAIMARKCVCTLEQPVRMHLQDCDVKHWRHDTKRVGLPNAHMTEYDCWDQNGVQIREYLKNGDYEAAYLQIKSAIAGINITDNPVMVKFCRYFRNFPSLECITDAETGEVMSIEKANQYYKEKEEA